LIGSVTRFLVTGAFSVGVYVGGVALLHRGVSMAPPLANIIGYLAGTYGAT
jgi:putative flippase GtrA